MAISIVGFGVVAVDVSRATEAQTQQVRLTVSIGRAPLNAALLQWARLFGVEVAHYSDVGSAQIIVGPVAGTYSREESLQLLLRGTDLTYRFVNDHTVAIIRRATSESVATPDAPRAEPPILSPAAPDPRADSNRGENTVNSDNTKPKQRSFWSKVLCLVTVCSAATLPTGQARAQEAVANSTPPQQSAPGQPAKSADDLQEIVVTAERRTESIDTAPIAITAVSGDELQHANVVNAVQLQYLAPSMQVSQTGQGIYIAIRGITTTDQTSKGEPGIQFNTDGIPVSRAEEQAIGLFDLQRVEILAGPQGTLYGKSSTGGALNVITNAPVQQEQGFASIEAGNYNTKRFEGMLNEPLTDNIAFRAAVSANYRQGYISLLGGGGLNQGDNDHADENNVAGRFSLLGNFGADTSLRLTFLAGRIDGVGFGAGNASVDLDKGDLVGTTTAAWNPIRAYDRDDFHKLNGQFETTAGPVRLTYLGSYSRYNTQNNQAADQFYDPGYDPNGSAPEGDRLVVTDSYTTTYHELRFSNRDEGKLEWLAGLNYWWEQVHENGHNWEIATPESCPSFSAYCTIVAAGGDPSYQNVFDLHNTTDHQSVSAFAHAVYALTPDWHIKLGARESRDEISRVGTIAANWFQIGPGAPPPPTLYPSLSGGVCINTDVCVPEPGNIIVNSGGAKFDKFVWTVGTDYQFTQSQFGYVTIATGYKAGGFNDVVPSTGKFGPYAPENMTAYELGYKAHTPGFSYNSSLYYYDYSNEQINANVLVNGNSFGLTMGVPTQLYGWENGIKWAFTHADDLTVDLALEHSKYVKFAFTPTNSLIDGTYGTGLPVDLTGRQLDKTPEAIASLGYTHTWVLPSGATLGLHGNTRWSSSYVLTEWVIGQQYHQGAFTRSNADLTYTSSSGKLQTELFVTNIENKEQVTGNLNAYSSAAQFPTGYSAWGYGQVSQPRFFGVRESVRF